MSGKYNGLKVEVAAENCHAVWIHCARHSLNLFGQTVAECCQVTVTLFYFLEAICAFFTVSTHRHKLLTELPKLFFGMTFLT